MPDLHELILNHVNAPNFRPVKPKVIAKQLGFAGDDVSRLKRTIKKLVKEGKLAYGPSHLICPVVRKNIRLPKWARPPKARKSKHVVGTFRRAQGGFGFVRP